MAGKYHRGPAVPIWMLCGKRECWLCENISTGIEKELIVDRIIVTEKHFQEASEYIRPHLSKDMLQGYTKMINEFQT